MQTPVKKHLSVIGCAAGLLSLLWGCASIGNPSGGRRDEDPPRFLSAKPAPGSVNVDPSEISIEFNELVNVKDAYQNVVLSPPGESTPRVSTRGRRVVVNITDTLLPNTTYTIDFGDAIEDNNESNKLSGFAYTFSTGPDLDSLRISGMVLGAEDMEPQQGVFVGAYVSKEDSAFVRMPFQRLARTDEYGRFVLRGLKDTTYRIFALKDLDNDKHYANPEEDIAWFEDLVRPSSERILAHDTIRDLYTGAVDTVVDRMRTRFLPNNVLLRMFNTRQKPQYLVSYTRPDSTRLEFIFNSPSETLPSVKIIGTDSLSLPLKPEHSVGNDTLTFWLPRDISMRDTLQLALQFPITELATGLSTVTNDTVKLMKPKVKDSKKDKKKKKKNNKKKSEANAKDAAANAVASDSIPSGSIPFGSLPPDSIPSDSITDALPPDAGNDGKEKPDADASDDDETPKVLTFQFKAKGPDADLTLPLTIEAPVPLASLDTLAFMLEENPDSVWGPAKKPYKLERADTLSERRFKIEYPWERGKSYRVSADTLAAVTIYGLPNDALKYEFKTKPAEELSTLKINLAGMEEGIPAFVQLLQSGDKPKYTVKVVDNVAHFVGIESGKYYVRVYEDFNGDGKFTPGTYRLQRVFGAPDSIPADTLAAAPADSVALPPDTLAGAPTDSMDISVSDSIAHSGDSISVEVRDSMTVKVPAAFVLPLTEKERMDQLKKMGYSFQPLENDSVGTDILIAIQPDLVYFYPKTINVKKNWDIEQTWNVFETALDLQKPNKIKKNKPKRKDNETQEEEEEEDEDEFGTNPFNPNERRNRNKTGSNFRKATDL